MADGKTPDAHKRMFKAVKSGDAALVRELLGADPSLVNLRESDDATPLHYAAWKGHAEVATLLLDSGADVNAKSHNPHWGNTPLHAAAHGNQRAVAEVLLARGADVHAEFGPGRTPLRETEAHNAKAVANLLKKHGAKH